MPVFSNALAGAAGQAGGAADFKIERSLRFNGSTDSAYLDRTPSSDGNRRVWTWSGWVKKSSITSNTTFFSAGSDGSNRSHFMFDGASHQLRFFDLPESVGIITSAVFRDASAWYHFVLAVNTTLNTTADRVKIYVNGERITSFSSSNYPGYNAQLQVNRAAEHRIGSGIAYGEYFHGYVADVNFVDGQQLDATEFGETNTTTGVWDPKEFSGTYGTNGYHLDFSDNSSDAALGTDSSGNNNTWTVNNLSAGANIANKGFDVLTYTGAGTTQTVGGLNFQPGLVWIKSRTSTASHELYDSLRGATKRLFPSLQNGESTITNGLTGFTSNGFTLGGHGGTSGSNTNYVAWCWKGGGTATTNNDGNISSQVSANTAYGFSIVKYTGNGSTSGSVGHGLGNTPKFVIVKRTDAGGQDWKVRHTSLGSTEMLSLNQNYGAGTASWNGETSSVFYPARSGDTYINGNTNEYIAYCWSEVPGFSKFGSWTGNGSSTGPLVTLGFKPRFVLFKRSDTSGDNWTIFDTARDSGTLNFGLQPNVDDAEQNFGNREILVNNTGFRVTSTGSSSNENGATYIYAAFAEGNSSDIDSLLDSPTNYEADSGNNGGNYCTINPLSQSSGTFTQGNLRYIGPGSWAHAFGTMAFTTGKWYYEVTLATGPYGQSSANDHNGFGWGEYKTNETSSPGGITTALYLQETGWYKNFTGSKTDASQVMAAGDVLSVAVDLDANTFEYKRNNSSIVTGTIGGTPGRELAPFFVSYDNQYGLLDVNFGQRPFAYTPPTGYKSLCTQNFDDPLIEDPSTAFDVVTYSGSGYPDLTNPSQSITGLSFSPDFVWAKARSAAYSHGLFDSVRGPNKGLRTNGTNTETNDSGNSSSLVSFDSNGFTVGPDAGAGTINYGGTNYVAWTWDGGSSNTTVAVDANGSGLPGAECEYRANTTAGFSIVRVASPTNTETRVHGLNKKPDLIICKSTGSADSWHTYHSSLGYTKYINLNGSGGANTSDQFGSQEPTSTYFYVKANTGSGANAAAGMIYYIWTAVPGYSAFGSYTGNGSADGPFVYTGFKPAIIIQKRTDSTGSWTLVDTARDIDNPAALELLPNSNAAEYDNTSLFDILSNGFKVRATFSNLNASGGSFIYIALAENPFKTARAR